MRDIISFLAGLDLLAVLFVAGVLAFVIVGGLGVMADSDATDGSEGDRSDGPHAF
jgi:hypothetical protein